MGIKQRFTALDDAAYRALSSLQPRPVGWVLFGSGVFLALVGLGLIGLGFTAPDEHFRWLGVLQLLVGLMNAGVGLRIARRD